MEDKLLVRKILNGDKQAKKRFYQKYYYPLIKVVSKRTKNKLDSQDIVQETFISAFHSLPSFKFRSSLFSWLCSIAHHETSDYYRKHKLKKILFSQFPFLKPIADKALTPENRYLKNALKKEIYHVLEKLSEGYHQILRLKYIEGLSMKEISKKLKITTKAVESRLYRARKKFKHLWSNKKNETITY